MEIQIGLILIELTLEVGEVLVAFMMAPAVFRWLQSLTQSGSH